MDDNQQDKPYDATPFKLSEAKKKGSVFKSSEVGPFLAILSMLIFLIILAHKMCANIVVYCKLLLTFSFGFPSNYLQYMFFFINFCLKLLILPCMLLVLIYTVGHIMQSGFLFSMGVIRPDFTRINPKNGFQKIFSKRTLYELFKTGIKIALFFILLIWIVWTDGKTLLHLTLNELQSLLPLVISITKKLFLLAILFMVVDIIYSQHEFSRKMKMSKHELTEEIKKREGDPRVKRRIRELQQALRAKITSMLRVKDADVLIVNPDHIAIAIGYNKLNIDTPLVLAKGTGYGALYLKTLARFYNIPIVYNKILARALSKEAQLNKPILYKHYSDVAKILLGVL